MHMHIYAYNTQQAHRIEVEDVIFQSTVHKYSGNFWAIDE